MVSSVLQIMGFEKENGDANMIRDGQAQVSKSDPMDVGSESSQDVGVSVSVGSASMVDGIESTPVLLSLRPPQGNGRVPTDIICVIAKVQNEQGVSETTGLTILDVTKHAVRTIFNVLEPNDRMAIVSFADDGKIDLKLTAMNEAGQKEAETCIEKLQVRGGTNLWAGVEKGLDVAQAAKASDRLTHVLLLTDGVPTCNPPKGKGTECEHLREYKENHGGQLPCTLTTFGFGYNLLSKTLTELAEIGSGSYAFIPDSGLVGTVFVNAMSTLLCTMAYSAELCLEPIGDAEFAPEPCVLGGHLTTVVPEGTLQPVQRPQLRVNIGTLQFGQSKDVVVRMRFGTKISALPAKKTPFGRYKAKSLPEETPSLVDDSPYLNVCLTYKTRNSAGAPKTCTSVVLCTQRQADRAEEVEVQCHRLNAASCISQALSLEREQAATIISDLSLAIKGSATSQDDRIQALLEDLDGQVSEALSRQDYFTKWGQHYLPSLRLAHLHQQCNNFKDPGVQHYAGDFFSDVRDVADDIFLKLPPPKPSQTRSSSGGTVRAPQDMSMFYNCGGGCFDGDCKVSMADGTLKALNQVSQGDNMMTPTGIAEVICVVKTLCRGGKTELVELPGSAGALLATPWHPVRVAGAWCFPSQLANASLRTCPAVYNLVLAGNHPSMLVSGVECSVLGHGLKDPVATHEFFGTSAIIEALERMPGWQAGLVELVPEQYIRDPTTGRVCGLCVEASTCEVGRNLHCIPLDMLQASQTRYATICDSSVEAY
eukprot:gnl/MRDRNA2_/MRDRNA2_53815_c0_seq1.p1 gnl/MRDRNA2_/MRDRNA2_53815_c0~~gnl/MRDRNA2_/MRDRNA2_53815_c0_seq1.p1  ORF type:complete len:765 (+),score=152.99 gnl/MRDRNA2_/MRDRNA2_53815_c0_seq1:89-2383(+)